MKTSRKSSSRVIYRYQSSAILIDPYHPIHHPPPHPPHPPHHHHHHHVIIMTTPKNSCIANFFWRKLLSQDPQGSLAIVWIFVRSRLCNVLHSAEGWIDGWSPMETWKLPSFLLSYQLRARFPSDLQRSSTNPAPSDHK